MPALAAAQRPDLSGTWVAVPGQTPASLPAAPSAILGARFGLRLEADRVVITRPAATASMISTLPLDGSRVSTPAPGRLCEGERIAHETAAWEGNGIVLTLVGNTPAGMREPTPLSVRTVIYADGPDRVVVEGTMVQQGQRRQVGSVYRRTTDTLPPAPPPLPLAGTAATISQVSWIGTTWAGTTGPLRTEERWTPPASGGMMATARTLRGEALASFEFLCIAERSGTLVYLAMPNARMPATTFVLTAITPTSATFENPGHDFPKMIRYAQTPDGGLETTIAGADGARAQTVALRKAGSTP